MVCHRPPDDAAEGIEHDREEQEAPPCGQVGDIGEWFTSSQISANGSSRVRQLCSLLTSLGTFPKRRYFRAVFSSIPDH